VGGQRAWSVGTYHLSVPEYLSTERAPTAMTCDWCDVRRAPHVMVYVECGRKRAALCPNCWTAWLEGEATAQARLEAEVDVLVELSTSLL